MNEKQIARFLSRINTSGPVPSHCPELGPCHEWQGTRTPNGYGLFSYTEDGKRMYEGAHRIAWRFANGPIPAGMNICHKCDNRPCCREDHLFPGTTADNAHDRDRKGRTARGDRSGPRLHPERMKRGEEVTSARLTEAQVVSIRAEYAAGESSLSIARRYRVSKSTIAWILRRQCWQHVPESNTPNAGRWTRNHSEAARGKYNARSKFVETDIPVIRSAYAAGESMSSIGRRYGVGSGAISNIILGKTWKYVP